MPPLFWPSSKASSSEGEGNKIMKNRTALGVLMAKEGCECGGGGGEGGFGLAIGADQPRDRVGTYECWGYDDLIAQVQDPSGNRYHATQRSRTPILHDDVDATIITAPDYPCGGDMANYRDALALSHQIGNYDAEIFTPVVSPTTLVWTVVPTPTNPRVAVGVAIDWGIALGTYAPFDATIVIAGVTNVSGVALPRNLGLRFTRGRLGGRLVLPYLYRSSVGMNKAQNMVGLPLAEVGMTVTLTAPASIITAMAGSSMQLLTPFTEAVARFSHAIGATAGRR